MSVNTPTEPAYLEIEGVPFFASSLKYSVDRNTETIQTLTGTNIGMTTSSPDYTGTATLPGSTVAIELRGLESPHAEPAMIEASRATGERAAFTDALITSRARGRDGPQQLDFIASEMTVSQRS